MRFTVHGLQFTVHGSRASTWSTVSILPTVSTLFANKANRQVGSPRSLNRERRTVNLW